MPASIGKSSRILIACLSGIRYLPVSLVQNPSPLTCLMLAAHWQTDCLFEKGGGKKGGGKRGGESREWKNPHLPSGRRTNGAKFSFRFFWAVASCSSPPSLYISPPPSPRPTDDGVSGHWDYRLRAGETWSPGFLSVSLASLSNQRPDPTLPHVCQSLPWASYVEGFERPQCFYCGNSLLFTLYGIHKCFFKSICKTPQTRFVKTIHLELSINVVLFGQESMIGLPPTQTVHYSNFRL